MLLASIIDNTIATSIGNRGPVVLSQNDDFGSINFAAGLGDVAETLKLEGILKGGWSVVETLRQLIAANDLPGIRLALADQPEALERILRACIGRADLAVSASGEISVVVTALNGAQATWHGLGKVVDRHLTATEAVSLIGADYTIEKIAARFDYNGQPGVWTGKRILVRNDTGVPLGFVTDDYQPIQNTEIFGFLNEVVDDFGAHIETAGVLGDGERVWAMSKHPTTFEVVPGDELQSFTLATAAHDGSASLRFLSCSHRVVCANTRRNALTAGRGKGVTIRHSRNYKQSMRDAVRAIRESESAFEHFTETASVLSRTEVNPETYVNGVLDRILDVTASEASQGATALASALVATDAERDLEAKRYQRKIDNRESVLADILDRYESDTNTARGTAWSAYNAVTEAAEHGTQLVRTNNLTSANARKSRAAGERRFDSTFTGRIDVVEKIALEQAIALA